MKKMIICLALVILSLAVTAQWKAQTAETYDNTYRMAYVTSAGGNETLRILRNMTVDTGQKTADVWDQVTGQVLLNKKPDNETVVVSLVFRFDDSPKMYIHQPAAFRQEWDASSRRYIIESDWARWRPGDIRDKQVRKVTDDANSITKKVIIDMLKTGKKVSCQIVLLNKVYGTQSTIVTEFTLQNSTKSINYLFR